MCKVKHKNRKIYEASSFFGKNSPNYDFFCSPTLRVHSLFLSLFLSFLPSFDLKIGCSNEEKSHFFTIFTSPALASTIKIVSKIERNSRDFPPSLASDFSIFRAILCSIFYIALNPPFSAFFEIQSCRSIFALTACVAHSNGDIPDFSCDI